MAENLRSSELDRLLLRSGSELSGKENDEGDILLLCMMINTAILTVHTGIKVVLQ